MVSKKSKSCSNCFDDEEEDNSFRLPNELLNNFKEIRSLVVKLPGLHSNISSENGSGALLKWKAEFGKELESCVILGETGSRKSEQKQKNQGKESRKDGEISPPANLTNKQLRKRVVWTISCLIASFSRHHMWNRRERKFRQ
ncbi:hypothetical protein L6452_02788 [Arctium lappa]|uniref:Uncharacterized protein n=1 Tax=Arctium lappa TaxID=4217 RepID=A0ACB9FKK0_ARCLA|nr:hypothetical protein L6452_02788 [Arctium lappa]